MMSDDMEQQPRNVKIVVLSGLSGAGKTTLGERMKTEENWIHFDGDTWMSGGDPIAESGSVRVRSERPNDAIQKAFQRAQEEGYNRLFVHEDPSHEAFEKFYELMCNDVVEAVNAPVARADNITNEINLILSHSIYCARTRQFVKRRLEELLMSQTDKSNIVLSIHIVVVRCLLTSLVDRRTERAKKQAAVAGKASFEDYLKMAIDNGFDLVEPTEIAFREKVALWNNGFDDAVSGDDHIDEEQEYVLDVTDGKSIDEMFEAFKNIIKQT